MPGVACDRLRARAAARSTCIQEPETIMAEISSIRTQLKDLQARYDLLRGYL